MFLIMMIEQEVIGESSLYSASNYFSKVLPDVLANRKKTVLAQRAKRVEDISQLATTYLEMEEMLEIDQKIGSSASANSRKTKMYNIATLINSITSEIQLIDKWCENRMGPNCEIPTCFGKWSNGLQTVCNGHGTCSDVDTCVCDGGYMGSECTEYSCFGVLISNKTGVCSGNGACVSFNNCNCKTGFYGDQCQYSSFKALIEIQPNFVRRLSVQNEIPKSCKEYLQFYYQGDTGNGLYMVKPRNTPYVVYCDMDSGGYTLLNSIISEQPPSGDLGSYNATVQLSSVIASSILREFKGSYSLLKNSLGESCVIDTQDVNMFDQILTFLCQPVFSSSFADTSFSQLGFGSPLKYWFY